MTERDGMERLRQEFLEAYLLGYERGGEDMKRLMEALLDSADELNEELEMERYHLGHEHGDVFDA